MNELPKAPGYTLPGHENQPMSSLTNNISSSSVDASAKALLDELLKAEEMLAVRVQQVFGPIPSQPDQISPEKDQRCAPVGNIPSAFAVLESCHRTTNRIFHFIEYIV